MRGQNEGDDERHGVAFYIAAQEPACGISIYFPEPGGRVIKEGVRVRGVFRMRVGSWEWGLALAGSQITAVASGRSI